MPFTLLLLEVEADVTTVGSDTRQAYASTCLDALSLSLNALRNPLKEDVAECADLKCLVGHLVK